MQRCLYLAQDFLGVAANWNSCCQNVEPPSSALLIVIYSDHKILTDLTYWNKFVIFVNDNILISKYILKIKAIAVSGDCN